MAQNINFDGTKEIKLEYNTSDNDFKVTNTSKKNLLIVAILKGGVGTINDKMGGVVHAEGANYVNCVWDDQKWYSLAGSKGNNVQMLKDSTLLAQAEGGSGSIAGVVRQTAYYTREGIRNSSGKLKGFTAWQGGITGTDDKTYKIAREGQVVFYPYIFPLDSTLDFKIVGSVKEAHFNGEIILSPLEIDIKWESKLESKIQTNLNTKSETESNQTQDSTQP